MKGQYKVASWKLSHIKHCKAELYEKHQSMLLRGASHSLVLLHQLQVKGGSMQICIRLVTKLVFSVHSK